MNITQVKIYRLEASKVLALASITLDNEFVVSGLRVLSGQNGMWVSMPSKKNKEGTVNKDGSPKPYSDVCFPITREAREEIQNAVISKYDESLAPHEIYDSVSESFEKKENAPIEDISESDLPF